MPAQKTKVLINGLSEKGDNYIEVRRMFHEHISAIKEEKKERKMKRKARGRLNIITSSKKESDAKRLQSAHKKDKHHNQAPLTESGRPKTKAETRQPRKIKKQKKNFGRNVSMM